MGDPVYALATPVGRSAIAVIRITGKVLPAKLLNDLSLNKNIKGVFLRSLSLGLFSDDCLILNFPSPNSYTGEHLLEIHTHGNPVIVGQLFSYLEKHGLAEAGAGEFSKRAFINNKIDLSAAESIMSGVFADSSEELAALEDFRSGLFGTKINALSKKIEKVLVSVESQLDFSDEEGVVSIVQEDISIAVSSLRDEVSAFLQNYIPHKNDGDKKRVVLTGKPNVGKSSLFNSLLGERVALVSDGPGTTRDVVRNSLFLGGIEMVLEDTAGLRDVSDSPLESEGMKLTNAALDKADLCLSVFDSLSDVPSDCSGSLVVLNKADLFAGLQVPTNVFFVSAKTGFGVEALKTEILRRVRAPIPENLVSERIYLKLQVAHKLLTTEIRGSDYFERTAQMLREALEELEGIYGAFDNETILDQIFSNFCIGK